MSESILWQPVRTLETSASDDDFAADQTAPSEWSFVPEFRPGTSEPVRGIMLRFAFLDTDGLVLAGRGQIDLRIVQRSRQDGCIFDSAVLSGAVAHRVYVVTGIQGTEQYVPAVADFADVPGSATHVRFYHRVF